jgi:hypothetical protein
VAVDAGAARELTRLGRVVQVTGRTFLLSGKANGFDESNPSARISGTFS